MPDAATYDGLASAAKAWVLACLPNPEGSNRPDSNHILAALDPECRINYGHAHFISTAPPLQGVKTGQAFVDHMLGMASRMHTWRIHVLDEDTIVDVEKRKVMIHAKFYMVIRPEAEVLNDIIFTVKLDESGSKIVAVTEYIDPTAAMEIKKLMENGSA